MNSSMTPGHSYGGYLEWSIVVTRKVEACYMQASFTALRIVKKLKMSSCDVPICNPCKLALHFISLIIMRSLIIR